MKFWIQVSRIDVNRIIMAELSVALDYTSDIDIRTSCPSSHSLFQWLEKKFLFSNCWPFEFESDVFRLYFNQTVLLQLKCSIQKSKRMSV